MAAQELRWLTYLLTDLGEPPRSPPVLYVDNKAMLALCREQRLEHRTKHIALRYFLARELQQRGQLRLAYVASEANTADVFTKALAPCDHQRCCTQLGLHCKLLLVCWRQPKLLLVLLAVGVAVRGETGFSVGRLLTGGAAALTAGGAEWLSYNACLLPTTYGMLHDNLQADVDLPELDPDMYHSLEHRWDIATMTVKEAMDEEIWRLIANGTWELVERLRCMNVMRNRWMFYSADYDETYAPVGSYITLTIFLIIAAVLDLHLMQHDMKNVFM
ncbi:unnamed protein product [Closterium sp. NIES-54]